VLIGCANLDDPERTLSRIVFPNKWAGDIDTIGFNEPSGICWHPQRKTLFLVGDEGDICEITTDGELVRQKHLRDEENDFEGITCDPATGLLYVAVEEAESVLEIQPETFAVLREFSLPRQVDGKVLLAAGGEGIEAITFAPDPEHRQGGLFYVANQTFTLSDEQDISAVFCMELPLRDDAVKPTILEYFSPGIIDLAGLHYDAEAKRIYVVSDATNTMLECSLKGQLLAVYAFPGDNQEGIAVDNEGFIYIAQDTGGIIKLEWLVDQ
jgi:sugar lactone lactonase YvrE